MAPGDLLLDIAALAETVGLADWHSPPQWNMAKLPFADAFVPLYADHVARLVAALRGKSRKCLVLDLDNTVWGGVIGDDGLEGIRIAQGDPVGEAFLSLQQMALALRQRGIVLAVASKNNDETARLPFRQHPEMLLREDHIAVFQANWTDKPSNLKAIAEALSFGLDALVFVDDNPMERDLVRRTLPQVAVPELPDDPALYARTLAAAGYFEALGFSDEDRQPRRLLPRQRPAPEVAGADNGSQRLSGVAGHGHHVPSVRRHRPDAHRATDQQVQPVQPDDAPLHRGRTRRTGTGSGLLHVTGTPHRYVRRQRHDQHRHLPPRRRRMGNRHLADELSRPRPRRGGHGVAGTAPARPRPRHNAG